jgi:very-short-patch-repair endonuclease
MKSPVFAFLALTILIAVIAVLRRLRRRKPSDWPVKARRLLTEPEQVLFRRLQAAFPELTVFAQVAVSQLVEVQRVTGRQAAFNRISQLVADFVLCGADLHTIAVIELDDRSHESPRRAAADARKSAALAAAGIPLVRFNVRSMPNVDEIKSAVREPIFAVRI